MRTMGVPRVVRVILLALMPFALVFAWQPVRAAGEVTDCSTGAGLANAMNSGSGLITFNCGGTGAPATITITQLGGFNVPGGSYYTIDGGNVITLTGADANRLFLVDGFATLTLTNIILTNGNAGSNWGGAVNVSTDGVLVLDHATIQNSHTDGWAGGAIFASGTGKVVVQNNSVIQGNFGFSYGAINSTGIVIVRDSIIRDNAATTGGGAMSVGGTVTISNSQISGNRVLTGHGGGILITYLGQVTIDHSVIASNVATYTNAYGGGIYSAGLLTVTYSTFSYNSAFQGGGMDNLGTVTLNNSTLDRNSAGIGGGGGIYNSGTTTLNNSTLHGNSATYYGGGIFSNYSLGFLTLNNSTVSGNSAGSTGGGLYHFLGTAALNNSTVSGNNARVGGGIGSFSKLTLTNSTLSGNSAETNGGGIYNGASAVLHNTTVSNNNATQGGALYASGGNNIVLTNTILAGNPSGGNCFGTVAASKYSLSSDLTCALTGWTERPNPNGVDPLLTALGNYGGPTLVHMLKPGSPAINGVIGSDAPSTDQRGVPRPQDGGYDIGAVERILGETILAPHLYLPLLRR